jgi:hypothetical protein
MRSRTRVASAPASVIEVLDRVLDRGIVIDAWLRVSVAGLALVDVDARIVVASIRTYVRDADMVATRDTVARPIAAARPIRRARASARRRRPVARVMLRCADGCTFLRATRRSPLRCPADASRRCSVTALA